MLDPWANLSSDQRVLWLRLHGRGRHDPTDVTDLAWAWRTYDQEAGVRSPAGLTGFI